MHEGMAFLAGEPAQRQIRAAVLTVTNGFDVDAGHDIFCPPGQVVAAGLGALATKGPRMSSLRPAVILQAMLMPTKSMTNPMAPWTGSCNSRKGEASPNSAIIPSAVARLILGLPEEPR